MLYDHLKELCSYHFVCEPSVARRSKRCISVRRKNIKEGKAITAVRTVAKNGLVHMSPRISNDPIVRCSATQGHVSARRTCLHEYEIDTR